MTNISQSTIELGDVVHGVCSNKPRPSVQNNHSKGHQHWKRDIWHIRKSGIQTLCGIDSSEWLDMGKIPTDSNTCTRCLASSPTSPDADVVERVAKAIGSAITNTTEDQISTKPVSHGENGWVKAAKAALAAIPPAPCVLSEDWAIRIFQKGKCKWMLANQNMALEPHYQDMGNIMGIRAILASQQTGDAEQNSGITQHEFDTSLLRMAHDILRNDGYYTYMARFKKDGENVFLGEQSLIAETKATPKGDASECKDEGKYKRDYDILRCDDCSGPHDFDSVLPSEDWNKFAKPEELLCLRCIDKRATAHGLKDLLARFYFVGHAVKSELYEGEQGNELSRIRKANALLRESLRKEVVKTYSDMRYCNLCLSGWHAPEQHKDDCLLAADKLEAGE